MPTVWNMQKKILFLINWLIEFKDAWLPNSEHPINIRFQLFV